MNEFNFLKKQEKQMHWNSKLSTTKSNVNQCNFNELDLKENFIDEFQLPINKNKYKETEKNIVKEQEEDFDYMIKQFDKTITTFDCDLENEIKNNNSSCSLSTKSTESEEDIQIIRMRKDNDKRKQIRETKNTNIKRINRLMAQIPKSTFLNRKRISFIKKANNENSKIMKNKIKIIENSITCNKSEIIENKSSNNLGNIKNGCSLIIKKILEKKHVKSSISSNKSDLIKKNICLIKTRKIYKEDNKTNDKVNTNNDTNIMLFNTTNTANKSNDTIGLLKNDHTSC